MTNETYTLSFGLIIFLGLVSTLTVKLKLIPSRFIYPGLFCLIFLSLFLAISSKPKLSALGIGPFTFIDVLIYSFVTLIVCFLIFFLNKTLFKRRCTANTFATSQVKIIFYVILSAPGQEFLFRSFLHYSLDIMGILNVLSITVTSSLLFGIAHLGFGDKYLSIGTFIFGGIWGFLYFLSPNLLLISISHAIIGLFAFWQGLIRQETFFGCHTVASNDYIKEQSPRQERWNFIRSLKR